MKAQLFEIKKANLQTALFFTFFVFTVTSCSHKIVFQKSAVVPAAEGKVKIKKDNNSNYSIELEVLHLADPSRLQSAKQFYVVWIQTESNGVKNIGQLKSSSGFFSSTKKASLHTVTSFNPNKIFITAEDQVNIQYPSGQVVLTTNNF